MRLYENMREAISLSLDNEVLEALKKRAEKKHLPISRVAEELLRKGLRLK